MLKIVLKNKNKNNVKNKNNTIDGEIVDKKDEIFRSFIRTHQLVV